MRCSILPAILSASFTVAALSTPASAAEHYVSPEGRPDGTGARDRPWALAAALAQPAAVQPGDTIWLRGGTYRGGFASQLKGREQAPITVRQAPGERAIIDCFRPDGKSELFSVGGEWTTFWGFEVTCSNPKRVTETAGSHPEDVSRGGVDCRGSNIRFVNLVVHDLSNGFGFWSSGAGGEIYGCLIYNNGWKGPDRGHGHAIYTQNDTGTKRLVDNVMFNQFAYGIHAYGSSKASLKGFHIEGNASFNNGVLAGPDERSPNILVGGGSPAERVTLLNNFTYHSKPGTSVRLGYGATNEDLSLRDNYFAGFTTIQRWNRLQVSGNTLVGAGSLLSLDIPTPVQPSVYAWDRNTYLQRGGPYAPLAASRDRVGLASNWTEWQAKLGLDANGTYSEKPPFPNRVFVRPNRYEPGRAHIVVYNWERRDAVAADLKPVLKTGQKYRVVSAQDYFGAPLLSGRYDGKATRLPLKPQAAVRPIEMSDFVPPETAPEFAVFVVIPES